jgi:hypothetical protein
MAGKALRAAENLIRQDEQDFMDSKASKNGLIQSFRCIEISSFLIYSLDTTLDPQITQIPQTLYRKCIRDRSKVAWRSYLG